MERIFPMVTERVTQKLIGKHRFEIFLRYEIKIVRERNDIFKF